MFKRKNDLNDENLAIDNNESYSYYNEDQDDPVEDVLNDIGVKLNKPKRRKTPEEFYVKRC